MTPWNPPAMAKECEALCNVFFGSHKPTTVSGFPPETVLQPRTGLRYTHRSVQRLKYSVFWERKSNSRFHKNTSKEVVIKQRSHAKLFAIHFFGLPNIFSSTTLTLETSQPCHWTSTPRMLKLTRPAKVWTMDPSRSSLGDCLVLAVDMVLASCCVATSCLMSLMYRRKLHVPIGGETTESSTKKYISYT